MSSLSHRLRAKDRSVPGNAPIAAIDIGSSKIACFIAGKQNGSADSYSISGCGRQASDGIKAGAVVDMEALERAIRAAVADAEESAETRVNHAVVGISGPDLTSRQIHADLPLQRQIVNAHHLRQVTQAAMHSAVSQSREILHVISMGYRIDGVAGVRDPRGMCADVLSVDLLVVSAPGSAVRNAVECVTRAHISTLCVVASPYASALSTLVEDEKDEGAILIDMGGGVTGIAAFRNGVLIHLATLPIGGDTVSSDLAQGLGTTLAAAERVKTRHGRIDMNRADVFETVEAPRLGRDGRLESGHVSRGELAGMMRPRVEEIYELVGTLIEEASATGPHLPRRLVLSGGASALVGTDAVASEVLGMPARLAGSAGGDDTDFDTPGFSAAAGLLKSFYLGGDTSPDALRVTDAHKGVLWRRVVHWMRANF